MRLRQTLSHVGLAAALMIAVSGAGPASAQSLPAMPETPTTRILAIGHLTAAATPEAMKAAMPQEVRDTVRLYLSGRIEQWYGRKDTRGVVFVINSADPAEARALLEKLPLGQRGLMAFDLIPLGPLAPLGLLLGPPAQ